MPEVTNLRIEHHEPGTIGIGEQRPRISWSVTDSEQEWIQNAYELEVLWSDDSVARRVVKSPHSRLLSWPWRPLVSRERAVVRVRVAGSSDDQFSPWSDPVVVETGLFILDDWKAFFIEPVHQSIDFQSMRPIIFGTQVQTVGNLRHARLYATAHGIYEAFINDTRVGDHVLAPGWTSYHHRLIYQTYDVTSQIKDNATNDIRITVADGWYRGRLGWNGQKDLYGDSVAVLAMLVLEYEDGRTSICGTDSSWKWAYGPYLMASLYDGETYDDSAAITFETNWDEVRERPIPPIITAPEGPPIRQKEELPVIDVIKTPQGKTILDFGQNLAGWVRFELVTTVACTIQLIHGEVLVHGELCRRPLRQARATDTVTVTAGVAMKYEPSFTFHGFRYVQVDGWPERLDPAVFKAIAIHSDMARTGHFTCSSGLLNRLHQNVVWSMRSNFLSIPTDCPQRDERLGWTGDINVFSRTGSFLFDTAGVLTSWLKDTAAEQDQYKGIVPLTVPNIMPILGEEPHAIWGDVIIMLPWSLYKFFGDKSILANHFADMNSWLGAIPRSEDGLWDYRSDWKLGDWLDPEAPSDDPGKARTDPLLVSDAFLVHVTSLMKSISAILERKDDERRYTDEHQRLFTAFQKEYIAPSGRLAADTTTAYALAVHFLLYQSPKQEFKAAERLEWLVRRIHRFQIATGFAGTPYLGLAMTKVGLTDLFYRMLLERKCPSWLYPVTMGATTTWERWDSMLPTGEVNPGEMTSFNHYALGSVADWMHRVILGLRPLQPGWATFTVEPIPGGALTWAEGSYRSSYGECSVRWEIRKSRQVDHVAFWLRVKVPPNTRARIQLPGQSLAFWKGSGVYEFDVQYQQAPWPPRAIYARNMTDTDDLLQDGDSWER